MLSGAPMVMALGSHASSSLVIRSTTVTLSLSPMWWKEGRCLLVGCLQSMKSIIDKIDSYIHMRNKQLETIEGSMLPLAVSVYLEFNLYPATHLLKRLKHSCRKSRYGYIIPKTLVFKCLPAYKRCFLLSAHFLAAIRHFL